MKKLCLLVLGVLMMAVPAFAQIQAEESGGFLGMLDAEYPLAVSVFGFANKTTTFEADGAGGAASVLLTAAETGWFAVMLDISYSTASLEESYDFGYGISGKMKWDCNTLLVAPMAIFQRGIKRGESGFSPFIGAGFVLGSASISVSDESGKYESSDGGFGVIGTIGLRYYLSKFFAGVRIDASSLRIGDGEGYGDSSIGNQRYGIEVGYRF